LKAIFFPPDEKLGWESSMPAAVLVMFCWPEPSAFIRYASRSPWVFVD
jgi:hypothetical protein